MKKTLPIEVVADNYSAMVTGYQEAVDQLRALVSQCRASVFIPILMGHHTGIEKVNVSPTAILQYAAATDDATNRQAIRTIDGIAVKPQQELRLLNSGRLDWDVLKEAPDAAWNTKKDHKKFGYKQSLFEIQNALAELQDHLSYPDDEYDYCEHPNPLRDGKAIVGSRIASIQKFFEDIHYGVAVYTCYHASQLARALSDCKDPAAVAQQFQCWEYLVVTGKEKRHYEGRNSAAYACAYELLSRAVSRSVVFPHLPQNQPLRLGDRTVAPRG